MFNERLKELRLAKDLTQQGLADLANLSKPTISRFESNKKTPSRESVTKLAAIFGVTTDYLLGLSDHKTLNEDKSKEVKNELARLMSEVEKMNETEQAMILKMLQGAVNDRGD